MHEQKLIPEEIRILKEKHSKESTNLKQENSGQK